MSDWMTPEQKKKAHEEQNKSASIQTAGGLAIIKIIFFLIPLLIAKVLGLLIALFLKLGIVGKVLITILFIIGTLIVLSATMGFFGLLNFNYDTKAEEMRELIVIIICLSASVLLGIFWFWRHHYHTIKNIPMGIFSNLFMYALAIFIYGTFIVGIIVEMVLKITEGEGAWAIGLSVSLLIAIIFWLLKTKPYGTGYTAPPEE